MNTISHINIKSSITKGMLIYKRDWLEHLDMLVACILCFGLIAGPALLLYDADVDGRPRRLSRVPLAEIQTMIKMLFSFCLSISLLGCRQPKEKVISTYPNGDIREKIFFDSWSGNDSTGLVGVFSEAGRLIAEGRLNSGVKDGEWRSYAPDGSIKWKGTFTMGKLNGEVYWKDVDGSWNRTSFLDGVREGESQHFVVWLAKNNDTTYFYQVGQFRNDKPHGLWRKTDTNGVVLVENTFVDGKLTGYFTNRYPNGEVKFKGVLNINATGGNKFDYYDESGKKRKLSSYQIEIIQP
jgi:antitoxin component YwqK of YwqJK toxin-antitoxin module